MKVRLVALVPVLAAVLAGCSAEEAPRPEPLPSAPSPSPSPSPVALEVPPSAQAATPQGAAAFARYYLEVLHAAFVSGEVEALRAISHPECSTCSNFIRVTQEDEAAGKSFRGGEYTVLFAEATETAPGDALIDLSYDRAPAMTRDAQGMVLEQGPAEQRVLMQARALRQGDRWVMRGIRYPKAPGS